MNISDFKAGERVEILWPRGEGRWRGWLHSVGDRNDTVWVRMEKDRRPVDDDYMEWDPVWIRELSILELLAEAAQ